jgi:hypothetical protein
MLFKQKFPIILLLNYTQKFKKTIQKKAKINIKV